ncbi:hypothetical protein HYS54_01340 [Candidatus Micrarchaeota archaeon]|nr:hypothetical protein [Candidatus Micrarchaeota archaeon]
MGRRTGPLKGLVITPDIVEQLRQLGFRGKRPEDVVTSAVRFSRDVGSSLATGKEALAPTQAAVGRLNQLRSVLDELAMRQPVSGYFGGWLVNLGVIRPGEEIKNRDAMQRLGLAFTDVQAKLIGAGLTTGETAEGGFAPIFDNRRLRKLRAAKTADARTC